MAATEAPGTTVTVDRELALSAYSATWLDFFDADRARYKELALTLAGIDAALWPGAR